MKKRLSKEQWLDEALNILCQQDFGRLNIDRLVASLGVTKGSFYWHFNNRRDFVEQLIKYWDAKFTISVIEHLESIEKNGRELLLELMLFITHKQLAKHDFAIQALAQSEIDVFAEVKKVLKRRISFVSSLFYNMGFRGVDLEFRSRVTVMFMIQEQNTLLKESREKQLKRIQVAHALFTMPNKLGE